MARDPIDPIPPPFDRSCSTVSPVSLVSDLVCFLPFRHFTEYIHSNQWRAVRRLAVGSDPSGPFLVHTLPYIHALSHPLAIAIAMYGVRILLATS